MSKRLPSDTRILEALSRSKRGPLKAKELAKALEVGSADYTRFKKRLQTLLAHGAVYRVKGQRYAIPDKINLGIGLLSVVRSGDGFVDLDEGPRSVFVPAPLLASAMDGDRVVVRIEGHPRGRNPEGRVIKILQRAHPTVVGTFRRSRKFGFIRPQAPRELEEVLIPDGDEHDAREGDVVVVRITTFGDRRMATIGEVETVLGREGDPGVDVLSVIHGYGLATDFPPSVEEAAVVAARDRAGVQSDTRVDRTDLHVFTIDPSDAKDHDDALSATAAGEGLVEVGVHIADVSWFVEAGGVLDLEALGRGTSVYLVDRVIPMLPHALSSDACSLVPDQDRFALSLFATLDGQGRVRHHRFERTVIRSRHRLSYEQAGAVLDGTGTIDSETDEALRTLQRLAEMLRGRRRKKGALDFDLPESRVVLDEKGEPEDIRKVERLPSHTLVEDFMLLANQIVAREGVERKLPLLYRVHDPPSPDRIRVVRDLLEALGRALPKGKVGPKALQRVLDQARGGPAERLISTTVLRSMSRAHYSTFNGGHFGLATRAYAHFTSPIRRYPDLQVHRVVVRALVENEPVPDAWGGPELQAVADQASQRERLADEAQRDSVALKKAEFMERHLGDEFDGNIAGVVAFGFFVVLERYYVEGLVHVNSLRDDYYVFRQDLQSLVGERSGRTFQLGDPVRIRVSRVDKEERKVDFVLLEDSPRGRRLTPGRRRT